MTPLGLLPPGFWLAFPFFLLMPFSFSPPAPRQVSVVIEKRFTSPFSHQYRPLPEFSFPFSTHSTSSQSNPPSRFPPSPSFLSGNLGSIRLGGGLGWLVFGGGGFWGGFWWFCFVVLVFFFFFCFFWRVFFFFFFCFFFGWGGFFFGIVVFGVGVGFFCGGFFCVWFCTLKIWFNSFPPKPPPPLFTVTPDDRKFSDRPAVIPPPETTVNASDPLPVTPSPRLCH